MSEVGLTAHGPVVEIRPGRSTGWWGMIGLIVTETVLFGLLLFTYFYFQSQLGPWPPEDLPLPELRSVSIRSVLLLGSSLPMWLAERALVRHGSRVRSAVWLVAALVLSAIFLEGHMAEQGKLLEELHPFETAYGTTFMTIVNFHAAHLIVGMGILAFVLVHVMRSRITQKRHTMLKIAGMYWHFVDVIWVFVFSTLYLSPHLLGR